MSAHSTQLPQDNFSFEAAGGKLVKIAGGVGVVGLGASLGLGFTAGDGLRQFLHSYMLAFLFFMTIALGALFFVTIQYLTRAGWSATVRRLFELVAGALPVLGLLLLPVLVPTLMGNHELFSWVNEQKVAADHLLHHKAPYLNVPFFLVRVIIYFGFWSFLSHFFLRNSSRQDESGDPKLTSRMQAVAAPGMIAFALTLTFSSVDLVMSLSPHWFSTMIGVYFFAGAFMSGLAFVILFALGLQRSGHMTKVVTTEHYHDLGKLMFGFVFFWGYIAFSQFMLIWYGNIPEETEWYLHRMHGAWGVVSLVLLFGHFVIPFVGLISRHVKRNRAALGFWAGYLLVMHWIDLYWYVMPQLRPEDTHSAPFHVLDVTSFLGIGGIFLAAVAFMGKKRSLVAVKDPRLTEALSFENV